MTKQLLYFGTEALLLAIFSLSVASAEVMVDPTMIRVTPKRAINIKPQDFAILEIANFETEDPIAVDVQVLNDVYKDLSAYIVDAPNAALARQKLRFEPLAGVTRKISPFRFMTKAQVSGPHYLILDNRFANVIEKRVVFQTGYLVKLADDQRASIKADFDKLYVGLKSTFNFKDFNIHIKSCGQSNAFSTTETGDVTICSELMHEMAERKGALNAVILHELGHTLLNLWGYPNYGNEDDADQFAVVRLLRAGDRGKQALYEWMQWYAERDTRAEVAQMISAGDTHALSVQRIRNIQAAIQSSDALIQRWNTVLYPNMTTTALNAIVANPTSFDNVDAAKKELSRREN
ncbi:MAG TPA: DUF4344 domain-containing metallopeptidase [Burkholderiales bacterium]|nr:DUF4344 domain-containing metallopeptidase [Burkholderiales bacterium]